MGFIKGFSRILAIVGRFFPLTLSMESTRFFISREYRLFNCALCPLLTLTKTAFQDLASKAFFKLHISNMQQPNDHISLLKLYFLLELYTSGAI